MPDKEIYYSTDTSKDMEYEEPSSVYDFEHDEEYMDNFYRDYYESITFTCPYCGITNVSEYWCRCTASQYDDIEDFNNEEGRVM